MSVGSQGLPWFQSYGSYGARFASDMTLFQNFSQAHRGGSVLILPNRLSDMYIHLRLLIPEYELPRATMILSGIWEQIWFPIARPRQASAVLGCKNATRTKSDRTGPEKCGGGTRSFVRGQGTTFLGFVFSPEFHFVCDFTIQILYADFSY